MPASGGSHILSDLDHQIMAILWRDGRSTVRSVWRQIARTRPIAYVTVMTAMTHLVGKGLLHQERRRGAATHPHGFVYHSVMPRRKRMRIAVAAMGDKLGAPA
jgi:predicted transcriptional regulator